MKGKRKVYIKMKKVLYVLFIILLLFTSLSSAEEQPSPNVQSNDIIEKLATIYDRLLYCIEQEQTTFSNVKNLSSKNTDINSSYWFWDHMLLAEERAANFFTYALSNGFKIEDVSSTDSLYYTLFMPLYDIYKANSNELATICMTFSQLVFYNEELFTELDNMKTLIKAIIQKSPDFPHLSYIQDLYKKTKQLSDYVYEANNMDYWSFNESEINEYQKQWREIKSDIDLIIMWPPYKAYSSYSAPQMDSTLKSLYGLNE